jgi:hypothetical protein
LKLAFRDLAKFAATAGPEVPFPVQAIQDEIILAKNQDFEITVQVGNEILQDEFIIVEKDWRFAAKILDCVIGFVVQIRKSTQQTRGPSDRTGKLFFIPGQEDTIAASASCCFDDQGKFTMGLQGFG